jgi:integrase
MRKSLDLTNWEAAQRLVREWEVEGPEDAVTVEVACERFLADGKGRELSTGMISKYTNVMLELGSELGDLPLRSVKVDDVRKIREGWKLAPITMQKRLEMLRSFFRFCVDSGWIEKNPAKTIKLPVVRFVPTLPYTKEQMKKILAAAENVRETHPKMPRGSEKKLKALILLMRYSGLRISDAVSLKREAIGSGGRLFLYQAKTGHPVVVPLPEVVIEALRECDEKKEYYFWTGIGKLKSGITEWQDRLKKVFVIAGIPGGHSHQLRDSFAVSLLERGVSLETVSILLGHQNIRTTQMHYAPWVHSRQLALEESVKRTWV